MQLRPLLGTSERRVDCASDLSQLGDEQSGIFKCQVLSIIGEGPPTALIHDTYGLSCALVSNALESRGSLRLSQEDISLHWQREG